MNYMYDKNNPDQLNTLTILLYSSFKLENSILGMGFEKHVKEHYQNTEQELS